MSSRPVRRGQAFLMIAVAAATLTVAAPGGAQQHAHTHGRLAMDVAVDAQAITLQIESPLDGFLGFERAPRTDAERTRVSDLVASLTAADRLFVPDPAAACSLAKVELDSAVLGLGPAGAQASGPAAGEHADIDMNVTFTCARAAEARFIDIRLFEAYERIQTIDAKVASPQGQFKRTVKADAPRLSWGR